jgi:hypothetical protein
MFPPKRVRLLAALILAASGLAAANTGHAADSAVDGPRLGLNFTELPRSVKQLRFVFELEDGLEIDAVWIAQNVGDVAPANSVIARAEMVTRGPLNVAALSRPKNGWPLGLYRLELRHQQQTFHTVYYVIEDLDGE